MTLDLSQLTAAEDHPRTTEGTADAAGAILSRWRGTSGPALRAAVGELHPWPARMAAFAFGWADHDGTPLPADASADGGKGLRSAITLLCARAAGGTAEAAVAGAVAVELVHAFSLVHDDIMDGDERRRHRDALWKAYGVGPAVLAGDGLLALAMATLARQRGTGVPPAMEHLATALVDLVDGQAEDLSFESRPWTGPGSVTVEEYLAMAEAKTGALLGCAAAVGTLLGGGSAGDAELLAGMGRDIGLAFQMTDDILGIWGDPAVTGKPASSDLRRDKKTLPVLAALRSGTRPGDRLAGLLARPRRDEATLRRARRLIEEAGGLAYTRERVTVHLDRALAVLQRAHPADPAPTGPAWTELATLCRHLALRTH